MTTTNNATTTTNPATAANAQAAAIVGKIGAGDGTWLVDMRKVLMAMRANTDGLARDAATCWLAAFGALMSPNDEDKGQAMRFFAAGADCWMQANEAALSDAVDGVKKAKGASDARSVELMEALARMCTGIRKAALEGDKRAAFDADVAHSEINATLRH